jgi:VIT1/CCC1 family predicted Fe2+/Mn2+ transporter
MHKRKASISYFRNFIFGVEDSLVSTVGLLSGIAIAGIDRETIFLTGAVLIFVEAFSMAAGSFLSESSAEEYESGTDQPMRGSIIASAVMFASYFISGFIPLSAYILWPVSTALVYSILFSLITLLALGAIGAKLSNTSVVKDAIRMVLVGGIAIAIGTAAGTFISNVGIPLY